MEGVNTIKVNSGPEPSTLHNEEDVQYSQTAGDNLVFPELFTGNSLLELSSSFWKPSPLAKTNVQPYVRGCKWSPDGTCCLSAVNCDGFHIMELPRDLYEGSPSRDRMISYLPAVVHVKEGGEAYDFCWYPKMNSYIPESCSWITTKKNSPIQMWDAYNGSLRCSYRGYNAVDEMEPALSVTFINDGARIVGGYRNCLRTFDVERPGRDFTEHKIKSTASCLATKDNLMAVGSWNANIKLFSINDLGKYGSIGNMHGHKGGITHIQFTPDSTKLVSGARRDSTLLVWDLRFYRTPLNILHRCVLTNQRIYFDISSCGRYLVSGGSDGVLRVWDDEHAKWTGHFNVNSMENNVTFRFHLYQDSCNSVSIHPSRPIIATGSGQFHFVDPIKVLDQESDDERLLLSLKASQLDIDNTSIGTLSNVEGIATEVNKNVVLSNNDEKSTEMIVTNDIKDEIEVIDDSTISQSAIKIDERESCNEPPAKRRAVDSSTGCPVADIGDTCNGGEHNKDNIKASYPNGATLILQEFHQGNVSNLIDSEKILSREVIEQKKDEMNIELSSEESKPDKRIRKEEDEFLSESTDSEQDTTNKLINLKSKSEVVNEENRLPVKAHKIITIQVSPNEPELDRSEKSCVGKDFYAKEMLYSSYTENNLNFWWIAGVSKLV